MTKAHQPVDPSREQGIPGMFPSITLQRTKARMPGLHDRLFNTGEFPLRQLPGIWGQNEQTIFSSLPVDDPPDGSKRQHKIAQPIRLIDAYLAVRLTG